LIDSRLSPERRVTFESRWLRDVVVNVLRWPVLESLVGSGVASREERAARLIQRLVRRLAARRELRRRQCEAQEGEDSLNGRQGRRGAMPSPWTTSAEIKGCASGEMSVGRGKRELASMLRRLSLQPRKTPADTLQISWIDDDSPLPQSHHSPLPRSRPRRNGGHTEASEDE
jgi:hypothetical protein